MQVLQNISLKRYNTFGIDIKATQFIEIVTKEELLSVLNKKYRILFLEEVVICC